MRTTCTKTVYALLLILSLLGGRAAIAGESPVASTPDVAASQLGDNVECTKEYSKSGLKNLDLDKTGSNEAGGSDKKSGEGN